MINLFDLDTPIRILHTCWTFIWGLIYILFTYLLYKYTQYTYIYEGVLQWGECKYLFIIQEPLDLAYSLYD